MTKYEVGDLSFKWPRTSGQNRELVLWLSRLNLYSFPYSPIIVRAQNFYKVKYDGALSKLSGKKPIGSNKRGLEDNTNKNN